jgi:phosphatidylinositol dimannoside acyltransferase
VIRDVARLTAFRLMAGAVYALPRPLSYRAARVAGTAFSLLPTRRRAALRANIAVAHGASIRDRSVRRDVRRAFQYAQLNYVDMFLLPRPDTTRIAARLPVSNLDLLLRMLAGGKGVILVSAHYGNIDLVVQWLGIQGLPTLVPVEPIEPPSLRKAVLGLRGAYDVRFEAAGADTFAHLAATLRAGNIVVLVCDRDIQGTGQHVTFFGREVTLPSAAVLLALRTGAPVLGAFATRHADDSVSVTISGPLPIASSGTGRLRADLARGMAVVASVLEAWIRRDPGQWVVQQPVFEPEAPSSAAARLRKAARRPLALLRRHTGERPSLQRRTSLHQERSGPERRAVGGSR